MSFIILKNKICILLEKWFIVTAILMRPNLFMFMPTVVTPTLLSEVYQIKLGLGPSYRFLASHAISSGSSIAPLPKPPTSMVCARFSKIWRTQWMPLPPLFYSGTTPVPLSLSLSKTATVPLSPTSLLSNFLCVSQFAPSEKMINPLKDKWVLLLENYLTVVLICNSCSVPVHNTTVVPYQSFLRTL